MNEARVDIERTETRIARCGQMEVKILPVNCVVAVLQYSQSRPVTAFSSGTIDRAHARDLAHALLAFVGDETVCDFSPSQFKENAAINAGKVQP